MCAPQKLITKDRSLELPRPNTAVQLYVHAYRTHLSENDALAANVCLAWRLSPSRRRFFWRSSSDLLVIIPPMDAICFSGSSRIARANSAFLLPIHRRTWRCTLPKRHQPINQHAGRQTVRLIGSHDLGFLCMYGKPCNKFQQRQ